MRGKLLQRDTVVHGGNFGASPLHALHFLPTGTSKQDLSGMKSAWHRNVQE